jgi:hypothetical protein
MDLQVTNKSRTDVVNSQRLYADPRVDEASRLQPDNPDRVSSFAPNHLEIGPKLRYRADIDGLRGIAVLSRQSFYRPELDALRFAALKGRFTQVDSGPVTVSWAKSPSIPQPSSRTIGQAIFTAISEERKTYEASLYERHAISKE